MENSEGKNYLRSNIKIIEFALKKWKLLLIVAVISGAFAWVFSGPKFIAPKYTTSAVIYPANLGGYSGETRLEQMQQYLESNGIRDSIIEKFNLYDEYEIDRTQKASRDYMLTAYSEHISFDETRFESINIAVTSKDPDKAKRIAEEVILQLDNTIRTTEREKYKENLAINKHLLDQKRIQVDSLEGLIREISTKYGILDYISQSERVTEKYMDFLLSGKKGKGFEEAKQLYENLEKHGRHFHNLHAQLNVINEEYIARLHSYEHSLKDLTKFQTYSYVLVKPEVPDKKSSPVRWLIFVSAIAGAVGFVFVLLLFMGYQNK